MPLRPIQPRRTQKAVAYLSEHAKEKPTLAARQIAGGLRTLG